MVDIGKAAAQNLVDELPALREIGGGLEPGFKSLYSLTPVEISPHVEALNEAVNELKERFRRSRDVRVALDIGILKLSPPLSSEHIGGIMREALNERALYPAGDKARQSVKKTADPGDHGRVSLLEAASIVQFKARGCRHTEGGKPCQDYNTILAAPELIVAVSCDGVSGGEHTDLGAKIVGEVFLLCAVDALESHTGSLIDPNFIKRVTGEAVIQLCSLAEQLEMTPGEFTSQIVATTSIMIQTKKDTAIWTMGDGAVDVPLTAENGSGINEIVDNGDISGFNVVADTFVAGRSDFFGTLKPCKLLHSLPPSISKFVIGVLDEALNLKDGESPFISTLEIGPDDLAVGKYLGYALSKIAKERVTKSAAHQPDYSASQNEISAMFDKLSAALPQDGREALVRLYNECKEKQSSDLKAKNRALQRAANGFVVHDSRNMKLVFYSDTGSAASGDRIGLMSDGYRFLNTDIRETGLAQIRGEYRIPLALLLEKPEEACKIINLYNFICLTHFRLQEEIERVNNSAANRVQELVERLNEMQGDMYRQSCREFADEVSKILKTESAPEILTEKFWDYMSQHSSPEGEDPDDESDLFEVVPAGIDPEKHLLKILRGGSNFEAEAEHRALASIYDRLSFGMEEPFTPETLRGFLERLNSEIREPVRKAMGSLRERLEEILSHGLQGGALLRAIREMRNGLSPEEKRLHDWALEDLSELYSIIDKHEELTASLEVAKERFRAVSGIDLSRIDLERLLPVEDDFNYVGIKREE